MEYEDVLRTVGSFGRFQAWLCFIAFVQSLPNAFASIFYAFAHSMPDFHCRILETGELQKNSTEYGRIINQTIPWETRAGVTTRSQCEMFVTNTSVGYENSTMATSACSHGWSYSNRDTVIAEFNLVCEDGWKAPLAVLIYMVGMGLGSFTGTLSDRFGRKVVFLGSTYAQFLALGLMGLARNYASYAAFGFISGFSGISYVTAYVLTTEMMAKEHRAAIGVYFLATYSTGYMLTSLLGCIFPYWRHYLWAVALLGILYIPLIWLCPESLRWLLVSGKEKEAKSLLKKIASMNRKEINADQIYDDFQASLNKVEEKKMEEERQRLQEESSYLHALKNKTIAIRSIVGYLQWCVSGMLYYAIALNPSTLSGNHLVNMFLSGLVELPALAFAYFAVRYIGRVRSAVLSFFIGGASCCIAPLISQASPTLVTVLVLLGKSSVTATFCIAYLIVAEITPTLVRTTSMGVASVAARVGAVIMPYLMYSGQTIHAALPFLSMGVLALITGLLTALVIPETKDVPMPDTIDDALRNRRIYGLNMCKRFPKEKKEEELRPHPIA